MPDTKSIIAPVIYQEIPEARGYRFGDDGSVWSCRVNSGRLTSEWRLMIASFPAPPRRRPQITIRFNERSRLFQVHHLILRAFSGPCPTGHEAVFLDGDPTNVRRSNLKWAPRSEVRFWSRLKVMPSGCWEWQGSRKKKGYGSIGFGGEICMTHQLAYRLAVGPIPAGLFVLHQCDNPPCCRPDHLFLGTNYDNVQDMVSKGRHRHGFTVPPDRRRRGEETGTAKLTKEKVMSIRERYAAGGKTMREIGHEHQVSAATVCLIVNRRLWVHVE